MSNLLLDIKTDNSIIKEAIIQTQWAVNQQELKDYILNFENQYGDKRFLQNNKSNEWHVARFFSGNSANYTWFSNIGYFDSTTEVIGYTESSSKTINLNKKYLNRSVPEICNTLTHEYCHMVGMIHSLYNPSDIIWAQTAPYAIGNYVQYMVARKSGSNNPIPTFPKASLFSRIAYDIKLLLSVG